MEGGLVQMDRWKINVAAVVEVLIVLIVTNGSSDNLLSYWF